MKFKTFFSVVFVGLLFAVVVNTAAAQQPSAPSYPSLPDPSAPSLTLDEKISLTIDDIKKADLLDKAQKAYLAQIKPIQDHEDAAKVAIEQAHPGWVLLQGPQGWHFERKPEPAPAAKPSQSGQSTPPAAGKDK